MFADGYGVVLDPDVLTEVDVRTNGWAASLQLFHGSIRGRPSSAVRALAKSLSGANAPIYDFLAQEVLKNVSAEIEEFLIRAALLERIVPEHAVTLFSDRRGLAPSPVETRRWIDECDRLGLLSRTSQSSEARQLHPLLRDFLLRRLTQRLSAEAIRALHLGIANAVAASHPLLACRHYIEAGQQEDAMNCLGRSVMLTMGSGQWGFASELIDRLDGVRADPAVAALKARKLIEEGELANAAALLSNVDLEGAPPDTRAVFRHAQLSLGWRSADREAMFEVLNAIQGDAQTPAVLRDIAAIFVDASPKATRPLSMPGLVQRLLVMSRSQHAAGHSFYAAISLHNAAIAELVAGHPGEAIRHGSDALEQFERLSFPAPERFSTHAVLASCWLELGDVARAGEHIEGGLALGDEHGDVDAEVAYLFAVIGKRQQAEEMLLRADLLRQRGLSDLQADNTAAIATAFLLLTSEPHELLRIMSQQSRDRPLDLGDSSMVDALIALAQLQAGNRVAAEAVARPALARARQQMARRPEVRLALVAALANEDANELRTAISATKSVGHLALLEAADAIGGSIHLVTPIPQEIVESISAWPDRWRPVLRRQMELGNVPAARIAALLLEEHGDLEDVVRLRAFAKTYSRRGRVNGQLGRSLAKRVGPRLELLDLGRVRLRIGDRVVDVSAMRRKPASLLMYLATRPSFTATREQVLDELWPDTDPASGANSLNQSLYFLRRDIDPWYEDELSIEYVPFEGDLVWLDPDLVRVSSVEFLAATRRMGAQKDPEQALRVLETYAGNFAPEFEYEDWAINWRSRVQVAFLEFSYNAVSTLVQQAMYADAKDVALRALEIEPDARDVEMKLIALYWRLGSRAAASAQYAHFAARERADGLISPALTEICETELPRA